MSSKRRRQGTATLLVLLLAAVGVLAPSSNGASAARTKAAAAVKRTGFDPVAGTPAASDAGHPRVVDASRSREFALDPEALDDSLPSGRAASASRVTLPAPDGSAQTFAIRPVEVMTPGLAAKHPEIQTFAGPGLDDRASSVRITQSPLGFQASVRGGKLGSWYIDPTYHRDRSLYSSYRGADLVNRHGSFEEAGVEGASVARQLRRRAGGPSVGDQLRTYRLALISDPTYATYFGAANVTAAKVALMNRVDQVYEDEASIRLVLIANNDLLNLDDYAAAIAPNGACGANPCYSRDDITSCTGATLNSNDFVAGRIVGADSFDIGHLAVGEDGGGIAELGVVGTDRKAEGCTGIPQPDGDAYAIDYVAHEMGHQFGANHTFNGTAGSCGGRNRNGNTAVEPGSGTSIMAYAGICGSDDLQPHSDPYFSERSFQEITNYVTHPRGNVSEVQTASLQHFGGGDETQTVTFGPGFDLDRDPPSSFRIQIGGAKSVKIGGTNGVAYSNSAIAQAINNISGFAGTVAVSDASTQNVGTFTVTFGGGSANTDVPDMQVIDLADCDGCFGSAQETHRGGTAGSFKLTYGANTSSTVTYGSNFNVTGLQSALAQILPAGATAVVSGVDSGGVNVRGFQVVFGGTLQGAPASLLGFSSLSPGVTANLARTQSGGSAANHGAVTATGNSPPVVTAPPTARIPYRTPFALTGAATDADNDPLTYMWEQNDTSSAPSSLLSPMKLGGPLFRQFGTRLDNSVYDEHAYESPGENHTTTDPTRTFPDLAQILDNNTDARTGNCPPASAIQGKRVDCYSEFLPTRRYHHSMHFRLTARDGNTGGGGVASDDTTVQLASGAGPFLVRSPNAPVFWKPGSTARVRWSVAGTDGHGIHAADVRILLSTDGGLTFPTTLAAATRNDGTQRVSVPNVATTEARVRVEPVGNIFFDLSDADFTITAHPAVTNNAPTRGVVVQQRRGATVKVHATDADSTGAQLRARGTGLPRGFKIKRIATSGSGVLPGHATFRVRAKEVRGKAKRHFATVTVHDGHSPTGATEFDLLVKKRHHRR